MGNYLKFKEFMHFNRSKLKSSKKVSKIKHQKSILVLQIGILIFFGGYFTGLPTSSGENEELLNSIGLFNSEHIVENLRGDSISLSKYWRLPQGTTLSVNILNPVSISDETISIIKESIVSTEKIDIEDSLLHKGPQNSFSNYYVGWAGALENTGDTKIPIPKNFEVLNSQQSNGDIVVILSNIKDRSGNTGYTKTILEGDEIVKAFITIYDVDSLSNTQLGTIMRHEFGHAIGLGHSTAPEDLMAPTIDMTYPYISECNIDAIVDLYNEDSDGTTICEK
ncbi:matrixin family metalloprotease [Nitrosopumilus sp. b3]|uniref:matrixin family metalloprotease n=1 Tax=Nitrosopumilus sp. b3 TaxID=2109909 RepID=UPI002107E8ED|nr:matrixin family metalloprotease [Nitrosopumilus sp. b3]